MPDSPDRLAKLFAMAGTVVGPLLRSPVHRVLSGQLMVLDYTGGRSGKHYSFPIGYFTWGDDEVLAFSSRNWPKALRTADGIRLLIRGESHDATAVVVALTTTRCSASPTSPARRDHARPSASC